MTQLFPAAAPDVLYIVDLSSYVLRAYHAIAPLSSPSGEPTHAVHGTVSMLERLVRQCRPALLAIAMDSGRATFRKEIYQAYKANRPPAPQDLKQQMARCEQIVRAFNIPIFKQDGVEADDLIASAVKSAADHDLKVVIVAADKDLMQLVSERTIMWDTMRDRVFGVAEVEERFGVRIDQLRDLLALTGDSSDNIPGVPSVGPKTAQELLVEFGTLDGIYTSIEQVKKKGLRDKLIEHREQAFLCQRLVTLKDDCPVQIDVERLRYGGRDVPVIRQSSQRQPFADGASRARSGSSARRTRDQHRELQRAIERARRAAPPGGRIFDRARDQHAARAARRIGRRGLQLAAGQSQLRPCRSSLHGLPQADCVERAARGSRPVARGPGSGQVRVRSEARRRRAGPRWARLFRLCLRRCARGILARSRKPQ